MFFPSNYNEVIFMLLCTDVGNTNIKFALYKGEKLLMKLRFSTNRSKTADDYAVDLYTIFRINNVDVNEINGSIISSVVPIVTDLLGKAIFTVANVESLVVGPGIKTGLDIRLDNPGAVGSDIVCMCVALKEQYPCPVIVIGMGTATTILYMNEHKAYCGGVILPGVQISLDALTAKCALLPSVSFSAPQKAIGTNTADCIRSGIIYGNAAMIDGGNGSEMHSCCNRRICTAHCKVLQKRHYRKRRPGTRGIKTYIRKESVIIQFSIIYNFVLNCISVCAPF